jgi:collagen type IV alpha-3-binding protein
MSFSVPIIGFCCVYIASLKFDFDINCNLLFEGWQERHFVLKNGILSYYKNENDTQFGCRGSLMLNQSTIQAHDLDDCRFDICVNDCVWYLRAHTKDERETWIRAIGDHKRLSSGCASDSTSLKRHPSLLSLTSVSCASTASFNKIGLTTTSLKDKLAEIDTYKDILSKQIETLQVRE